MSADTGSAEPTSTPGSIPGSKAAQDAARREEYRSLVKDSIGGKRGIIDSGLPPVVFVIANWIGGLNVGIFSAIGAGVLILLLRLVRKESVQQAFSGFFGIAICVLIARQTGEARGYFLFGIWRSVILTGVFVLSAALRWPLVGAIWEFLQPSGRDWRRERRLMSVYTWTTVMWAASFGLKFLLERFLYDENLTGWLAAARVATGYPLTIAMFGATFLLVRRVRHSLDREARGREALDRQALDREALDREERRPNSEPAVEPAPETPSEQANAER